MVSLGRLVSPGGLLTGSGAPTRGNPHAVGRRRIEAAPWPKRKLMVAMASSKGSQARTWMGRN